MLAFASIQKFPFIKRKDENCFLKDTIADIRQQLDNLYSKKRSYGVYVAKKKAEISEMVQEVCIYLKAQVLITLSIHSITLHCFENLTILQYVSQT